MLGRDGAQGLHQAGKQTGEVQWRDHPEAGDTKASNSPGRGQIEVEAGDTPAGDALLPAMMDSGTNSRGVVIGEPGRDIEEGLGTTVHYLPILNGTANNRPSQDIPRPTDRQMTLLRQIAFPHIELEHSLRWVSKDRAIQPGLISHEVDVLANAAFAALTRAWNVSLACDPLRNRSVGLAYPGVL